MVVVLTWSEMVDVYASVGGRATGTVDVDERTFGGTGGVAFGDCNDGVVVWVDGEIETVAGTRGGTRASVPCIVGAEFGMGLRLRQYWCGGVWDYRRPGAAWMVLELQEWLLVGRSRSLGVSVRLWLWETTRP